MHSVVLPTLTTAIWFFHVDFEVHKRYRFCALKGVKINPVSSRVPNVQGIWMWISVDITEIFMSSLAYLCSSGFL